MKKHTFPPSAIRLVGRLGDRYYYFDKDGNQQSRPVRKRKVDPNKPNKGAQEFIGSTRVAASIRAALGESADLFTDRTFYQRLNSQARKAISRGTGQKGERSFEAWNSASLFSHLPLDKKRPLSKMLHPSLSVEVATTRTAATLQLPKFSDSLYQAYPKHVTHVTFTLTIAALCDHHFVGGEKGYAPEDSDLNTRSRTVIAQLPLIPMEGPGPDLLTAELPGIDHLPDTAALIVAVGIAFGVNIGGEILTSHGGAAMDILGFY